MSTGFGALPGSFGDQGVTHREPLTAENQSDDIRKIRLKYCIPDTEYPQPFSLAALTSPPVATNSIKFDLSQTPFNSIIISCLSSPVNLFFGENSGSGATGSIPHIQIPAGIPFQFALPGKGRIVTLQNPNAAVAQGAITFLSI